MNKLFVLLLLTLSVQAFGFVTVNIDGERYSCYRDGGGPDYPDRPGNGVSSIEFFHSDSCHDSKLLAQFDFRYSNPLSECMFKAKVIEDSVWAVKMDGKCFNITDLSFAGACQKYFDNN